MTDERSTREERQEARRNRPEPMPDSPDMWFQIAVDSLNKKDDQGYYLQTDEQLKYAHDVATGVLPPPEGKVLDPESPTFKTYLMVLEAAIAQRKEGEPKPE